MLQKQTIDIPFAQGLDTKTDPWRVPAGKFLQLKNSAFNINGQLTKRNGFGSLTTIPEAARLTTFMGNLLGVGQSLYAFSGAAWINQGSLLPVTLEVQSASRSSSNQTYSDSAQINTLACICYSELSGSTRKYQYSILSNGNSLIAPTTLAAHATHGQPKVFALGNNFVIVYADASGNLVFISINSRTLVAKAPVTISSLCTPLATQYFDGVVANNSLYLAFNGSDMGGALRYTYIDSTLTQHNTIVDTSSAGHIVSVSADTSGNTPTIYVVNYDAGSAYVRKLTPALVEVLAPTSIYSSTDNWLNVTCAATGGVGTILYETSNAYSFDSSIKSNYVTSVTITGSTVGTPAVVKRSVGLGSKAFILGGSIYFLAAFSSPLQPTYYLCDVDGDLIARLAYSNGGGYYTEGLPSVYVSGSTATCAYLFKDLVTSVNKGNGSTQSNVYTQTGTNLATFTLGGLTATAETGSNLHLSGGYLWMYDGVAPVEHGFHQYPESIKAVWSATGGSIHAQPLASTNTNAYYYQVVYQWTDAQGNSHVSAPSVPVAVTTTSNGTSGSITLSIPTLRLTAKTNVTIQIFRWSAGQQTFYQTTSITTPTLNSTSSDSITYVDTLADSSIVGNSIIYTNGGVLENICAPATSIMTLWQSRYWQVDAEDPNLLWFSKQVIEATPVEMSDLLTYYVSPTMAAQGNTGPVTALSAMDDKLIVFKKDAIYYVTGVGPSITGASNQYSDPVYVTSTVGCANPASIAFIPGGLMFQSDKGIWLLGRDLSTSYIGAAVERYNDATVLSATSIPGTNQVRFVLSTGTMLVYDYFFQQWGEFTVSGLSSTLYNDLHTYVNSSGRVFQETPGQFLDGSTNVLMSFTTSWLQLAGLQGYQRAYEFTLIGSYLSSHSLNVQIAYDYEPAPSQQATLITPARIAAYGVDTPYGAGTPYGGNSLELWRVFMTKQRCSAFQITISEVQSTGAGLTLSGLNCVAGIKKAYRPVAAAKSVS